RAAGIASAQRAARDRAPARAGLPGACRARRRWRLPAGAGCGRPAAVVRRRRGADGGDRAARSGPGDTRHGCGSGAGAAQARSAAAAAQRPACQCGARGHRQSAGHRGDGCPGGCGAAGATGQRLPRPGHAAAGLSPPLRCPDYALRRAGPAGELRAALVSAGLGLRAPGLAHLARRPHRPGRDDRRAIRRSRTAGGAAATPAQGNRRVAVSVPGPGTPARHAGGTRRAHPALAGRAGSRRAGALLAGPGRAEHAGAGGQPAAARPAVRCDLPGCRARAAGRGAERVTDAAGAT
ncbi:hypothetical protein XPR_2057, partial [Xanthomonas arboricola pv. pruni MAFF 301420]